MLPSFRLIAATFLCGFFVVFAGLRLAASLNDIHEGLPVMAAHAAPVSITPVADREARRSLAAAPVMYDLRFVVSTVAPTLVRVPPTVLDQPAPLLSIVPPEAFGREGSWTRRPRPKPPRMQPNQRSRKPRSQRSRPPRRSFPESAVVPDAASRCSRRRKRRPSPPSTPGPRPTRPLSTPPPSTPQPRPRRRSPRPRRTSRKPRPRPPSKSPGPTRKPPLHRPRHRPLPQPVPSPGRVRPLPHSRPRNPKLPSHRPRNPRRARQGQGRAQEAYPCRPPRRADEPPGGHLRQFEPRLRHLARHRAALTSPVIRHGKSASGALTVCHDSRFLFSTCRPSPPPSPARRRCATASISAASPTGWATPASGWPSITTCRTSRARRPTS